jgi:hypothetical protein
VSRISFFFVFGWGGKFDAGLDCGEGETEWEGQGLGGQ